MAHAEDLLGVFSRLLRPAAPKRGAWEVRHDRKAEPLTKEQVFSPSRREAVGPHRVQDRHAVELFKQVRTARNYMASTDFLFDMTEEQCVDVCAKYIGFSQDQLVDARSNVLAALENDKVYMKNTSSKFLFEADVIKFLMEQKKS